MKILNTQVRTGMLLFLCFYSSACMAQAEEKKNNIVKLNLTAGLDPIAFPVIQLSYERKLNKRFSVAGEFGYQFYQLPEDPIDITDQYHHSRFTTNSDTSFVSPKGIKTNIEFRYYFLQISPKRKAQCRVYSATNFFFRYNKTDIAVVYIKDSIIPSVDCYWMKRTNWGVMQVFGFQFTYKRFALEFYGGIGYTDRNVSNYNREYNVATDGLNTNRHGFGAERTYLGDYNEGTLAMSLGIRTGVAF